MPLKSKILLIIIEVTQCIGYNIVQMCSKDAHSSHFCGGGQGGLDPLSPGFNPLPPPNFFLATPPLFSPYFFRYLRPKCRFFCPPPPPPIWSPPPFSLTPGPLTPLSSPTFFLDIGLMTDRPILIYDESVIHCQLWLDQIQQIQHQEHDLKQMLIVRNDALKNIKFVQTSDALI